MNEPTQTKPICPLRMIAWEVNNEYGQVNLKLDDKYLPVCIEGRCAFWVRNTRRCAVLALAENTWAINDTLNTIEEGL